MAQDNRRNAGYYYVNRAWVTALGTDRKKFFEVDRHPPQDATWWQHFTSFFFNQPQSLRVNVPISKYRRNLGDQRIVIYVDAIPHDKKIDLEKVEFRKKTGTQLHGLFHGNTLEKFFGNQSVMSFLLFLAIIGMGYFYYE